MLHVPNHIRLPSCHTILLWNRNKLLNFWKWSQIIFFLYRNPLGLYLLWLTQVIELISRAFYYFLVLVTFTFEVIQQLCVVALYMYIVHFVANACWGPSIYSKIRKLNQDPFDFVMTYKGVYLQVSSLELAMWNLINDS